MTFKGLSKLYRKTNVKVTVGIKQTKGTFGSTFKSRGRRFITYREKKKKKKFPLMCGSALGMASAPSYLKVAEYAGDT